jgi:YegS/Rv2252/BmrU family lipid kinase
LNKPDTCVIYNPAAGRGRAGRRLESLRRTLGDRAEFQATQGPQHAEELAFTAAKSGLAVVGAAGGDGTVHEVANGLLRSGQDEVALAVFPIGSANDYAYSLGLPPEWWLQDGSLERSRLVDIGLVHTPCGRQRYFVNGIGFGFNGAVTIESERIHLLQGVLLYSAALIRALCFRFQFPRLRITMDGATRDEPTLAFSVAIGQREGNFKLAPRAVVDDGLFDYLHVGSVARWEVLRYAPGMITGNLPMNHPAIQMGHCKEVAVHSDMSLPVHLDGEMLCRPEDDVREFEIKILPRRLRVTEPQA